MAEMGGYFFCVLAYRCSMKYVIKIQDKMGFTEETLAKFLGVKKEKLDYWKKRNGDIEVEYIELMSKRDRVHLDSLLLDVPYSNIDISMLTFQQIDDVLRFVNPSITDYRRMSMNRRLKEYESMPRETVGEKMRFIRSCILGYSQSTLGKAFYYSRSIVRDWEDDKCITIGNLCEFAKQTQFSIDYIENENYPLSLNTYGMDEKLYNATKMMVEVYARRNS